MPLPKFRGLVFSKRKPSDTSDSDSSMTKMLPTVFVPYFDGDPPFTDVEWFGDFHFRIL